MKTQKTQENNTILDFGDNKESTCVGAGSVWVHPDYRMTVEEFDTMPKNVSPISVSLKSSKRETPKEKAQKTKIDDLSIVSQKEINGFKIILHVSGSFSVYKGTEKVCAKDAFADILCFLNPSFNKKELKSNNNTRKLGKMIFSK